MSKETQRTYKFVRNTVLLIGLFLSMFIPTFQKYGNNIHNDSTIGVEKFHALDTTYNVNHIHYVLNK